MSAVETRMVIFLEGVVLSQVDLHITLNIIYQHIVHVYRPATITFVCEIFILRPIRLLSSDSSCSISTSVVVLVVFL